MKWKKYIAPIVVAAIMVPYFAAVAILMAHIPMGTMPKLLLTVVPLCLSGVIIYVLIQRVREIKSGEEDDLDKY